MEKTTPKDKIKKSKRALSVSDMLNYSPEVLPFAGKWGEAIGLPELKGAWIVYGESGNGKTSFALQLGKYFAQLGKRVAYNSIEEGVSLSMREAYVRTGMADVSRQFILLDKEPIVELRERLSKRRSPDVIIIDSVQYAELNKKEYKKLIDDFPNKLFVFISHADGLKPDGKLAQAIYYDAFVCILVKGFKALVKKSRYGGNGEITINERLAQEYWSIAE